MSSFKEYLKSSIITFVVAFGIVVLASIDSITPMSWQDGALFSLIFAAGRSGVKAVLELLVLTFRRK